MNKLFVSYSFDMSVYSQILLFSVVGWLLVSAQPVSSTYGVPEGEEALYRQTVQFLSYTELQLFTCKDGSRTLSIGQVNDDYCDCDDGSDEPGTCMLCFTFIELISCM